MFRFAECLKIHLSKIRKKTVLKKMAKCSIDEVWALVFQFAKSFTFVFNLHEKWEESKTPACILIAKREKKKLELKIVFHELFIFSSL